MIEFTLSFKCKDCSKFNNGDCLTLGTIGNLNAVIKHKNNTITIPGPKQYIVSIKAKHHYELSLPACDAGGANEDVETILMKDEGFCAASKGKTSIPDVDMDKLLKDLAGNENLRNAYDIYENINLLSFTVSTMGVPKAVSAGHRY